MTVSESPLDEQQWFAPQWLEDQFWGLWNGNLVAENVLWYFASSPFYDRMSNNAVVFQQLFGREHQHILFNPDLLEARLRTMPGVEFVIAERPAEPCIKFAGVWMIRKQRRTKRTGEEDEVSLLSTYYIVEGKIYMAPSAADLLKKSMLSIISSINKFMSTAAPLPDFSPALGHRYLPPPANRLKPTESQLSQGSKEATPLPDALTGTKKALSPMNTNASNYLNVKLLEESLNITLKYGDEYMDENPITGQPGDFHLSTTGRKEKDKLMMPTAAKAAAPPTTSAKPSAPPTPLKTDIPPGRKGSKSEKSPRTPGMPKPKRRKSSKAVGAGGISPT